MKSLISRESYRPEERYSGVYHIQGGLVTDADLDERSRITQERTDNLGDDTIKDGVPEIGGAVMIAADQSLSLREGVIYADGVRGILTARPGANLAAPMALFSSQGDFPESPGLPNNADQIIYADIWERPVYPLEDPYLADAGLHGAVTAFRTRTMTQLKAAPSSALDEIKTGTGGFPQIGTAVLAITPLNAEILADECDPCADVVSAEQIVSNALWRLEVIDVEGTPQAPGRITLAWSIENAAAIAPSDVDQEDFERTNKVYEFYSEITESHAGVLATASDAKRPAFVDDMSTTPTPATDHNDQPWPFVRRWDGQAVIDVAGAAIDSEMGGGFQISIAGQTITLRVDTFEAALDLGGSAVVAGDYWLVELRRFAPESERVRLVKETPVGLIHHYCVLFRVDTAGAIMPPTDAEIRKLSFPVLSDLPATHVGFDNGCEKLYADAENVQEALHNLCAISADDIAFDPICPELYDNAQTVQEALDSLCKIDFSVDASFRLLFDWGVLCGIIPSLVKPKSSLVSATVGAYMDRSGGIVKFSGFEKFDLSSLKLNATIAFVNERQLQEAFAKDEVCLALAAEEGGKTSVHVVPKAIAFGPDDPGFRKAALACIEEKQDVKFTEKITKFPQRERLVANKMLHVVSGGSAFGGVAKLTEAEANHAKKVNDKLIVAFNKLASADEKDILKVEIKKARDDNPLGGTQGAARQVRQMQRATAILTVIFKNDEQRLSRCVCQALFPTCPPELGKRPFYVPIACLRGAYDGNQFFLDEVCPFCCRKQAMTWRSFQYFIGDARERVAENLAIKCCERDDDDNGGGFKPGLTYDPGKYTLMDPVDFVEEYKVIDSFIGRPPKSSTDYRIKIAVNDLSESEARNTLTGYGIETTEIIDIKDENAFDIIEEKSVGVGAADRLISANKVRPGDKVGLLVQDGVARGYVLLERGPGKLPFPTEAADLRVAITKEEALKATELVRATNTAKEELTGLIDLRKTLSEDVVKLKADIETLNTDRERTLTAVNEAEIRLTKLAKTRTAITREIDAVQEDLAAADENRKTIVNVLRRSQPVTAIAGNEKPELIAKLAGAGINSVDDVAELSDAKIAELKEAGILTVTGARTLKRNAVRFINIRRE